jgi:hypothetical protein
VHGRSGPGVEHAPIGGVIQLNHRDYRTRCRQFFQAARNRRQHRVVAYQQMPVAAALNTAA